MTTEQPSRLVIRLEEGEGMRTQPYDDWWVERTASGALTVHRFEGGPGLAPPESPAVEAALVEMTAAVRALHCLRSGGRARIAARFNRRAIRRFFGAVCRLAKVRPPRPLPVHDCTKENDRAEV